MVETATTSAFYAARPTVSIDGQENIALAIGLAALSIKETTDGLFCCEATFGNWGSTDGVTDFVYFDRSVLDFGKEITIDIGEGDSEGTIFKGKITAIEGRFPQQSPPEILILAEDQLQNFRMVRRTRSFEDVNTEDIVNQIVNGQNMSANIDIDPIQYRTVSQVNQSDLAFLRQCARDVDAQIWMADGVLQVQARSRRENQEISMSYGHRLKEFSVLADLAHQRSSVTISGWDVQGKEGIAFSANVDAIQNEVGDGVSGSRILQDAFGERKEMVVHHVPLSVGEAESIANAHYRCIARKFLVGQGLSEGDARLKVGTYIELDGLGSLFSGNYYIREVNHMFDARNGYRTSFTVEKPSLGEI